MKKNKLMLQYGDKLWNVIETNCNFLPKLTDNVIRVEVEGRQYYTINHRHGNNLLYDIPAYESEIKKSVIFAIYDSLTKEDKELVKANLNTLVSPDYYID